MIYNETYRIDPNIKRLLVWRKSGAPKPSLYLPHQRWLVCFFFYGERTNEIDGW